MAVSGGRAVAALTVRDALGRELRTATADAGGTVTLQLERLVAGVYMVLGGGTAGRLVVD